MSEKNDVSFNEAPASATVRVVSPQSGMEWLLTTRAGDTKTMMEQVKYLDGYLMANGWAASGSYRGSRGNNGNGNAPMCPTHGKPMLPSKHKAGSWYCPEKIADDDGTGKPVYCKQKA